MAFSTRMERHVGNGMGYGPGDGENLAARLQELERLLARLCAMLATHAERSRRTGTKLDDMEELADEASLAVQGIRNNLRGSPLEKRTVLPMPGHSNISLLPVDDVPIFIDSLTIRREERYAKIIFGSYKPIVMTHALANVVEVLAGAGRANDGLVSWT